MSKRAIKTVITSSSNYRKVIAASKDPRTVRVSSRATPQCSRTRKALRSLTSKCSSIARITLSLSTGLKYSALMASSRGRWRPPLTVWANHLRHSNCLACTVKTSMVGRPQTTTCMAIACSHQWLSIMRKLTTIMPLDSPAIKTTLKALTSLQLTPTQEP